jgi:ATP-dependent Lon protease
MDKKCMNPIIFIDEVDKISKTENGREIVGILTHLLDSTQNDCFQDKYFSGIDIDLSKALFILSYNDVDAIDRVLLDRIHRIKFSNLSLEEKLVILQRHILPEILKKMGLETVIQFEETVLKFIIEEYTAEPGVRKLKELIFDIVGEINLDILKNPDKMYSFPIHISIEDITGKYFKDKPEIRIKQIPQTNQIGIANGMYANALGQGGVIPVQAKFFPSGKFLDIKITGLVGDVMNESCNVALSLAWNLTPLEQQERIKEKYNGLQKYGIHANFPEGSIHKNGPSAGSCITTVLYSLLNEKKIKRNVAMTGEISLDGCITAIGGLDYNILGSIKSGVTEFIYPEENSKDITTFTNKYKDAELLKNIVFHPVDNIHEVFEIIFE